MPPRHRITRAQFPKRAPLKRLSGTLLSVSIHGSALAETQASCIVSKKVSSSAAERNHVKRRCREALRALLSELPSCMIIVYPKRPALTASFADLKNELRSLLHPLLKNAHPRADRQG